MGGGMKLFVAITNITETGQPIYCVNPKETTMELKKAFTWTTRSEAEAVVHEAMHVYDLHAFVIEIVKGELSFRIEEKPQELMVG
jgi:hypothetical protein